jgi:hypothetical protein
MACTGKKEGVKPGTAKAIDANSVKILIRERDTGVLAIDGMLYRLVMKTSEEKNPELKESVNINSGAHIKVEQEYSSEILDPYEDAKKSKVGLHSQAKPKPPAWSKDPKAFEFVLNWTQDWMEHSKLSSLDDLSITVAETLTVEKVSDPKVTKIWSFRYDLREVNSYLPSASSPEGKERSALEQIKNVIVPARGPVLKEVLAFINANRTSQN